MNVRERLSEILKPFAELFDVVTIEAFGLRVLFAALILTAGFWLYRALHLYLVHRLKTHDSGEDGAIEVYRRGIRFAVMLSALMLALHALGLELPHLFTAGGLLAVAVAFAMKNLSENLVSGLILRLEQVIKREDVLCLEDGRWVRVRKIGMRVTVVRTKSEGDLIIPNAELAQNLVSNYTYRDQLHRIETQVGVAYSSDLEQVRQVLERVCEGLDWNAKHMAPQIRFSELGESSVDYFTRVWIDDPWAADQRVSDLNEATWWAFKAAGIVIAFPQQDVHLIREAPV